MSRESNGGSDGSSDKRELPVSRRSILAAIGTTGALGGGMLAASELDELSYTSTPVGLTAKVAYVNGYEPEPKVKKQTIDYSKDLVFTSIQADVTSYIYRYEYRRTGTGEQEDSFPTITSSTRPTGTTTEKPAKTPSPTETITKEPENEETEGTPLEKVFTPTETPAADTPPESSQPTPTTTKKTPTEVPAQTKSPIEDDRRSVEKEARRKTLTVSTTPDPKIIGQSLNPVATESIEKLIEERTAAFEEACDCTIDNPEHVEVRTTADPTGVQVDQADIGTTVYQFDPDTISEIPSSVKLLGEEQTIGYFVFATQIEESDAIQSNLVLIIKGTHQLGSGPTEAVMVSYTDKQPIKANRGLVALSGPESDNQGLFTTKEVKRAAERFTPVCPCLDIVQPGKGSSETWSVSTRMRPPLLEVTFDSKAGTVSLQLPRDITVGDRITSTIHVNQTNDGTAVAEYKISLGEDRFEVQRENPTFTIPNDQEKETMKVALHDADGVPVAETTVDVFSDPPGYPTIPTDSITPRELTQTLKEESATYQFPLNVVGETISIWGPFDGDASSTSIMVDGREAKVIAQSLRRTVVRNPESSVGKVPIVLNVYGQSTTGEVRLLELNTDIQSIGSSETNDLTLTLDGLEAFTDKEFPVGFLTVKNQNRSETELSVGTKHTLVVHPGLIDSNNRFSTVIQVSGTQGGEVNIAGEFSVSVPRKVNSFIKGAMTGNVDDSIQVTGWPETTNTKRFDKTNSGETAQSVNHPLTGLRDHDLRSFASVGDSVLSQMTDPDKIQKKLQKKLEEEKKSAKKTHINELAQDLIELLNKDELSTEQFKRAFKEAKRMAKCLVDMIYYLKYVRGWVGNDTCVNLPDLADFGLEGTCGQWTLKLDDAYRNCGVFIEWDRKMSKTDMGGTIRKEIIGNHQVFILIPPGGNISEGLVIDPWRAGGCPYFVEVSDDPDFDWADEEGETDVTDGEPVETNPCKECVVLPGVKVMTGECQEAASCCNRSDCVGATLEVVTLRQKCKIKRLEYQITKCSGCDKEDRNKVTKIRVWDEPKEEKISINLGCVARTGVKIKKVKMQRTVNKKNPLPSENPTETVTCFSRDKNVPLPQ